VVVVVYRGGYAHGCGDTGFTNQFLVRAVRRAEGDVMRRIGSAKVQFTSAR